MEPITLDTLPGRIGWHVDLGARTCRYTKNFQGLIHYVEQPDGLFTQETPAGTNGPAMPLEHWVKLAENSKL